MAAIKEVRKAERCEREKVGSGGIGNANAKRVKWVQSPAVREGLAFKKALVRLCVRRSILSEVAT